MSSTIRPAVVLVGFSGTYATRHTTLAAVEAVVNSGIPFVAPAGSFDTEKDACFQTFGGTPAILVGVTDMSDERYSPSSFGPCIDIFAPGINVESAAEDGDGWFKTRSGSNSAAAAVAGAVALILSREQAHTPTEVESTLKATATKDNISGDLRDSPNRLLYVPQPPTPLPTPMPPTPPPTPQPTTWLPASVVVTIGQWTGDGRKKCVVQPHVVCNSSERVNTDFANAPDSFEISQEGEEGEKVCAERVDKDSGWSMNLQVKCSPQEGYEVPDCWCTGSINQYKCTDDTEAHCAWWQECYATATFKKGKWKDGCRSK